MGDVERGEVARQVKAFIEAELAPKAGEAPIGADDDLFELGLLDSAGIAQLIGFVEHAFGVGIDDEDLVVENFATITAIARVVESKTAIAADGLAI